MPLWYASEEALLRRYYGTRSRAWTEAKIPRHSWRAIQLRAFRERLRRGHRDQLRLNSLSDCLDIITTEALLWHLESLANREALRSYDRAYTPAQLAVMERFARNYPKGQRAPKGTVIVLAERWGRTPNSIKGTITHMRRKLERMAG